jgi:NADH dehydrogenase
MQQGRHVARCIDRLRQGQASLPFHYKDKGSMAVIGRGAAVAKIGPFQFNGHLAWLAWLFIHLLYLVEFDNRLLVLVQWAWNYLTWNRGARLITGDSPLPLTGDEQADGKRRAARRGEAA